MACDPNILKNENRLVHKRVFVIYDTLEQDAVLPEKTKSNNDTSYLEFVFRSYSLENIKNVDSSIQVKLRYADTSNFLKKNFYDGLRNAYFPCEVALNLAKAQYFLKQVNPDFSLLIWDAARPLHIQQMMWDSLKMPNDRKYNYLSPPYETSLHNYGCAVDLTIMSLSNQCSIDMGCDFDTFEKISQPVYEQQFLKTGLLTQTAFENRRLLRWVMRKAGFNSIPSEWWHFSYGNKIQATTKFKLIQ